MNSSTEIEIFFYYVFIPIPYLMVKSKKKFHMKRESFFALKAMACTYEPKIYKKTSSFNEISKKTLYL